MASEDLVKEARALLSKCAPQGKISNGADAYLFDMRGPKLLSAFCDEIERLNSELDDIRECDKCDLCEDHFEL